jgi:hypothetical protein
MAPSHPSGLGLPRRPAIDIPHTNVDSFEHAELIEMIAKANPAQVHELGQMWHALGKEIMAFGAILERTSVISESIWRGQAASAARARLTELVTWCQSTGEGMRNMGTTVLPVQAEAAQTAQRSMPPAVPYDPAAYQNRLNSTSNPSEWAQIQHDAHEQAARHEAARTEAVRVVNTYIAALRSTNGTMPAFTPPPEFGTSDTEPGPGAPTPGSPNGGTHSGGGTHSDAKTDSVGGAAGVPGAGVHGAGATHRSPQTPPGVAALGGSPVPVGGNPQDGGHSPGSVPPASTPGQLVSAPVPGLDHSVSGRRGGNRGTEPPTRCCGDRWGRRHRAPTQRRWWQRVRPARLRHPELLGRTERPRARRGSRHWRRGRHPGYRPSRSRGRLRSRRDVPPNARWRTGPEPGAHRAPAPQLPDRDRGHLG